MTFRYTSALTGTPGTELTRRAGGTPRPFDAMMNRFYQDLGDPESPGPDNEVPPGLFYAGAPATSAPSSAQVAAGDTFGYMGWTLPGGGAPQSDPGPEACQLLETSIYLPTPRWTDDNQLPITVMQLFGNLYYQGQTAYESYPIATWDLTPPRPVDPGEPQIDQPTQEWIVRAVAGVHSFADGQAGGIPFNTWTRLSLKVTTGPHTLTPTVSRMDGTVISTFALTGLDDMLSANTGGYTVGALYFAAFGNFAYSYGGPNAYRFYLDDLVASSCEPVVTEPPAAPAGDVDYDNSGLPNQDVTAGQDEDEDGFEKDFGCPPRYLVQRSAAAPTRLVRLGRARAYRLAILDRGGRSLFWDVPERAVSAVSWERRANETGVHTATITKRPGLLKDLGRVRSWAHEAVIWRVPERGVPQLCAVGPVTGRLENADAVTITFKDLSAWWGKRVIHHDYSYTGCTDLTDIARFLINDGMAPDDPNFLQHARWYASGVSVTRSGAAFRLMLDKEISDLTALGLDWTMTGRRLIVGGELARIWPRVANLTRAHFLADVEVEEAGAETLTRTFAIGTGTTIGYAGGVDEQLGLLETTTSSDAVTDGDTARIAARAALGVAYPSPVYVRVPDGAGLAPGCPLTVDQLLPGIAVNVEIDGYSFPVGQTQRLTRVAGEWTRETGERIAVALSPYAGVPADDGAPVGPPDPDEDVETEPDETIFDQSSDSVVGAASLPEDGDEDAEVSDDTALQPGEEVGDEGSDEGGQPEDGPDTGAPDIGDNPNDSSP